MKSPTPKPSKNYAFDFKGKIAEKNIVGFTNYRGQSVDFALCGVRRSALTASKSTVNTPSLGEQPDLATAAREAWTRTSDPRPWPELKLFFAVYGRALQAPKQFEGFLEHVVTDWMNILRDAQGPNSDQA